MIPATDKKSPWYSAEIIEQIQGLIAQCGGVKDSFESELVQQMIVTSLKILEGHDIGQIKLMNRALKEMRYAFRTFKNYPAAKRVSIFGSARTPPHHPDYQAAKALSAAMAQKGWMCITGGAEGIMRAGLEGQQSDARFGLSIRLPAEKGVNELLEGDPKAISFRYFFTRKLMFMSHADALVVFPGGVGTMDELFEALTLIQTGKSAIIPIILMEGNGGEYWQGWNTFMHSCLLAKGMVSPSDFHLFTIARSTEEAIEHLDRFYHRYHSSRYVGTRLVIRLSEAITPQQLESIQEEFHQLVEAGKMELGPLLPEEEGEFPDLTRLSFQHTRRDFGLLRALIDAINKNP